MRIRLHAIVPGLAALFCAIGQVPAADWPQLNGPHGSGISPETGLARTWSAEGPRVLWTLDVAPGFAGAAVHDAQVFLLDRRTDQQDVLRCLDLESGKELWQQAWDAPGTLPYNGSRNVPTVDERHIFVVGPFGHFHCLDRRTHQVLWSKHLVDDFKDREIDRDMPGASREAKLARTQLPRWGLTQTPLVYRDTVIVAPQTQKTGLVAYEIGTGKIRWQSGYIGRNWFNHVSPCLATFHGVDQLIMLAQPSDPEKPPGDAPPAIIASIDPGNGAILWTNHTPAPHKIPIPQPLPLPGNRLFITGGYNFGSMILEVNRSKGQWETRILNHSRVAAGHIHSPILYRDQIYLMSLKEQGGKNSGLVRLDQDGRAVWQTGPGLQFENGSMLVADGMAFVMHGRSALLHLFELGDSGPKLLAKAAVLKGQDGMAWAPMALSHGRLLIRDQHQLKCLDVRASGN